MAKKKKQNQNQNPENNSNPDKSESGKSTKNSDGTYSYKRDDGTKVTFDPSKRGRNSRGEFTNETVTTAKKKSRKEAKEEKALKQRLVDITKTADEHDELSTTLYNKYTENEKAIAEAKKRGLGDEVQRLRGNRENIRQLFDLLNSTESLERQIQKSTITEEKLSESTMSELTKLRDDLGITNQDLEELDGAEYRDLSKKRGLVDALVEYSAKQESERTEAIKREIEREETPEEKSERWEKDPLEIEKKAKNAFLKARAMVDEFTQPVSDHPELEKAKKFYNDITESKTFVEGNYKLKDPVSAYKEALEAMPEDGRLLFAQTMMDVALGDVGELTGALALEATKARKELATALKEERFRDAASILYDVTKPAQKKFIKSQLKRALKTAVKNIKNNALKTTIKSHGIIGAGVVVGGDITIAFLSAVKDNYDNKRKEKAQAEKAESQEATSEDTGEGIKGLAEELKEETAISDLTKTPLQAVLLETEFQIMALLAGLGTNAVFDAGDPTIGLGALPILKIKEILETGDIDGDMRGLLAATLAGLIALGTQGIANNSRKQQEQEKEEKTEDR